jgi:hypothetical protein
MDDSARVALAHALEISAKYTPEDIPDPAGFEYDDFLWDELSDESLEDARQSPRVHSFFVVSVTRNGTSHDSYVSADWPSAEAFAQAQLGKAGSTAGTGSLGDD